MKVLIIAAVCLILSAQPVKADGGVMLAVFILGGAGAAGVTGLVVVTCVENKKCTFKVKPQKQFEKYKPVFYPQGSVGALPPGTQSGKMKIEVRIKEPLKLETKARNYEIKPKVAATIKKSKRLAKISKINRDSFKPTYQIGF